MPRNTLRLYLTADNKVAVRSFEEVGAASTKTADKVESSARKQTASLDKVQSGTKRLHGAVSTLAGTVGIAGLGFGIADLVKAGQRWQEQQAQLQNALKRTGNGSREALSQVNEAIDRLSTHGGFDPHAQTQGMTQLVRATGSVAKATRDAALATDIARGTHKDFLAVAKAVAMVEQGRTTGLSRLGIAVPKVTAAEDKLRSARVSAHEKLLALEAAGVKFTTAQKAQIALNNQVTPQMLAMAKAADQQATKTQALAKLQQLYGGSTAAYSKTTAGAISNAQNAIDLAMEKIGSKVLPIVARVAQGIAAFVGYLSTHHGVLVGFGIALGGLGAAFALVKIVSFARSFRGAAGTVSAAIRTILTRVGLMAPAVAAADTEIEAANAAAGASFSSLIPLVGAAAGAYLLLHKNITLAAGSSQKQVASAMNKAGAGFATHDILNQLKQKGAFKHHAKRHNLGGPITPHYLADGGPVGSDTVPLWGTPGEYMIRREAVQSIGVGNLNAINASGSVAGAGGGAPEVMMVTMPVVLQMGPRVATQEVVHFAAKRNALSGSYVAS